MRCKVGDEIRVVHDAVDRMEELGIELVGRGVVDLGPFHGAVVHQTKIGVNGEIRERVGRRSEPIEELLQVSLGNVADSRAGANDERQGNRQVLAGASRDSLQVFDEFHPIQFPRLHAQPLGGETLHEDVRGTGILHEPVEREFLGSGGDLCQQLAEVGREPAVVVETGRVGSNRNRVFFRAAFRLIPMGNEADDLSTNLSLRYGSKHVDGRHAADDTEESSPAQ